MRTDDGSLFFCRKDANAALLSNYEVRTPTLAIVVSSCGLVSACEDVGLVFFRNERAGSP